MEAIVGSIITGVLALVGVIVTSVQSNKEIECQLDKKQAVTDTKIEELTREVREHNHFAQRVPVLEEQMKAVCHRIEDLEDKIS